MRSRLASRPSRWLASLPESPGRVLDILLVAVFVALLATPWGAMAEGGMQVSATLSPTSGPAGSTVRVTVAGLRPGTAVQLAWDGATTGLPSAVAADRRDLRLDFKVPAGSAGSHSVTVNNISARTPRPGKVPSAVGAVLVAMTFTVGPNGPATSSAPASPAATPVGAAPTPTPASTAAPNGSASPTASPTASPRASSAAPTPSASAAPVTPAPATPAPATPAPTPPAATPTPVPQAGCARTFNGDRSGGTDVAGALQTFVNNSANGSVICLVAGGTYRVDNRISISRRSNLTFDGRGARLVSPVARNTSFIYVNEGSGIVIRNVVIEGANQAAGTPDALNKSLQHGHAIALESARSVVIEGTTVRRIFGDFVYVGTNSSLVWSDGVTIRNNDFALNGRMGIAVVAGRNVFIAGNSFDKVGMFTLDIEPNRYTPPTGGDNIEFSGNWVGTGTHTNLYSPLFFGALGAGNTTNVRILNNTLAGQALRVWVDPVESQYVRRSITVSGNVSSVRMAGPAMRLFDVEGVTVTNNRQPLSSGGLVNSSGSTNVTISGNNTNP